MEADRTTYFVTGGTGLVGSYVIRLLLKGNKKVRALYRSGNKRKLLEDVNDQIEWVEGNVLDVTSLTDAIEGCDKVIHSAAMVSFLKDEREMMYKVNIEGTANIVNVCIHHKVKKLLHVSSIAALGKTHTKMEVDESVKWEKSKMNSHYAITKHLAENEVWRGHFEGLETAIICPSTILGASYWRNSSAIIFDEVYNGLKFYTESTNGFVDVRDVAELAIKALESEINGERFIVSAENREIRSVLNSVANSFGTKPPSIKVSSLLQAIAWRIEYIKYKLTGKKPLITKETARMAGRSYKFSNSKVKEAFSFTFRDLDECIKETCEAYLESKEKGLNFGVLSLS